MQECNIGTKNKMATSRMADLIVGLFYKLIDSETIRLF